MPTTYTYITPTATRFQTTWHGEALQLKLMGFTLLVLPLQLDQWLEWLTLFRQLNCMGLLTLLTSKEKRVTPISAGNL
mgnify:CR=1